MPVNKLQKDLKIALETLKAREDSFRQFEEISKLGSWEVDLITKKSTWSHQSYQIYGLQKGKVKTNLNLFFSRLIPEDVPRAKKALQEAIANGSAATFEATIKRPNGELVNILINGKVIYDENKKPLKLIGTTQDITEYVKLKREAHELYDIINSSTGEIYILDDTSHRYTYVNDGAAKALGYTREELLNLSLFDINPFLTYERAYELVDTMKKQGHVLNRSIHKRKDGSFYHVQAYIQPIVYNNKESFIIFDMDITPLVELEKKQQENEKLLKEQAQLLKHQATHDALTNLPNRALFEDRLQQSIAYAKRYNKKFAVLFIDLDEFKNINDSFGHHVGDEVLIQTAKKLNSVLREEDTLCRLGGDEFTIILQNIQDSDGVLVVAEKILGIMKEPVKENLFISASIGIAIYPDDTDDLHDIIKFADIAMYKSKELGRNRYQFYSSELSARAVENITIKNNLHIALREKQFAIYYQAQFDAMRQKITGFEALVRWQHPRLGIVSPEKFIPIAQESDLIIDIDRFVMQEAMKQFCKWYADGFNPGILALNLAMKQLNSDDFLNYLKTTMDKLGFKPSWLELEVTEGQVMKNPDLSIEKLKAISDLGIEIAIDDFGTGYSSLSYLKKLPLDRLKIDRSFIKDIPKDEDDKAISKAIIALAKSLNLKLIAEGVENKAQEDFLQNNGCNHMQGFLYSQPMSAEDTAKLLK